MSRIATLAALIVFCTVLQSMAGWEYSAITRADGGQNSEAMNSQMTSVVDGDNARIEFVDSGSPLTPPGSFMVTTDGGKTLYMVDREEKTYARWDIEGMAGMAGGAMQMMNMKMSSPRVEKLLEEKGGEMAGFPTTHYRFRTSYTMEMNFLGVQKAISTVTEEDIWSCAELNDAGLNAWMSQQAAKTGHEQLDQLIQAERGKVKGFPLKRIVSTTTTESGGTPQVMKVTTEVTSIQKASPDKALFELPAGYKETSMFSSLLGSGAQDAGKSGQESGAEENPFMKIMQQMHKGK